MGQGASLGCFFFLSIFDDACIVVVKVCAVAAQMRHTKEFCSQFNPSAACGSSNSPGVVFKNDDSIQGQKESLALLRNVVKLEDVDDASSRPVGACACASSPTPLRDLILGLLPVEEILAQTHI